MADATVGRVGIRVFPELKGFRESLKTQLAAIAKTAKIDIPAKLDVDKSQIKIGDNITRDAGTKAGRSFSESFRNALSFELAERALSSALSPLKVLTKGIGFGVLAVEAAAATQAVVAFGAAVAPAAGIIATLPAGAVLAGAAVGTLAVALSGVSDAFKAGLSGDMADFDKAVAGLAPNAQVVAKEFRDLSPALQDIRTTVQNAFFAPLQGQLTAIGATLIGPVRDGMTAVADSMGKAAREVGLFAQESANASLAAQAFQTLRGVIDDFTPSIRPVLQGLRDIAAVGLSSFEGLGQSAGNLTVRFGEFLSQAARSGQALAWIENAKNVFSALGGIAKDVGGIISSVFRAASTAAGELASPLGVVGNALDRVNTYLKSAAGQTALVEIFRTLGTVGSSLGQVLQSILGGLGRIAPYLGQIAEMAGPTLARLFDSLSKGLAALGPGLVEVFAQIAEGSKTFVPLLVQTGQAINEILKAAAPLIPVIAQLATAAIGPLLTLVKELAIALQPVTQQLASQLAPVIPPLAKAFADLVVALVPILPPLSELAVALVPLIVNALKVLTVVFQILTPLISNAATTISFLAGVVTGAVSIITGFTNIVSTIPTVIGAAFSVLPGLVTGLFATAWNTATNIVSSAVGIIVGLATALPGQIMGGISGLAGTIAGFFSGLWNAVISLTSGGISSIVNMAGGLPGRVMGAIGGLIGAIAGWASSVWQSAASGFSSGVNAVVSIASSVTSRVVSAVSGLGGQLFSAGQRIIQMLANGIESAIGAVRNAASKVADAIGRFIPGSPVKEGPLRVLNNGHAGGLITEMLADGIQAKIASAQAAGAAVAGTILGALAVSPDGQLVGAGAMATQPIVLNNQLLLDGETVYDNQQVVAGRRRFRG